jgi:hypothetical protein
MADAARLQSEAAHVAGEGIRKEVVKSTAAGLLRAHVEVAKMTGVEGAASAGMESLKDAAALSRSFTQEIAEVAGKALDIAKAALRSTPQ